MRPSLGQVFAAGALASTVILVAALATFLQRSREAAFSAAERSRNDEAEQVEARVGLALGVAQNALLEVEHAIVSGAVNSRDPRALEVLLYTELHGARSVAEVTFSGARLLPIEPQPALAAAGAASAGAFSADPDALNFAAEGRFQVSVFSTPDGRVTTRRSSQEGDHFVGHERARLPGAVRFEAPGPESNSIVPDPTLHPTFRASAALGPRGAALWSDLHHSELDRGEVAPRVVLTVQKGVWTGSGEFLGVARVGLLTTDIDAITEAPGSTMSSVAKDGGAKAGAERVVLLAVSSSAAPAALVARVDPGDTVVAIDDDLRILPLHPPPEVAALLESPLVRGLDPERPEREGSLDVYGEKWLATLRPLSLARGGTAGWLVAVLVPEAHYTRDLVELARQLALVFGATACLLLAVGGGVLWSVRRGLLRVGETTLRMRRFDFGASAHRSRWRDLYELEESLERAKTVTRALCKYVPVPLVRRLHEQNRDPELGGEPAEVSLLFTDIQGFTSLSERLTPDQLARQLGRYFERMTDALEANGATIDKYIGDAVMAFWNAPIRTSLHATAACRGVLACQAALAELYASPEWQSLPALVTRFGLHRAQVLVGHFGAPSRLSYTALGDGVNLTSRLESLCKQYGVVALASDSIVAEARSEFAFRHIDRVIVAGKQEAVDVYELMGTAPLDTEQRAIVDTYEASFEMYLRRDFSGARARLERIASRDAPSRILLDRCIQYELSPPPVDWNGEYVTRSK
jgi:adenylate cyclase